MPVIGLGHTGLWVSDLAKMRDFYERVIGLTVTDSDDEQGIVFFSARPEVEHHEFVLQLGAVGGAGSSARREPSAPPGGPGNRAGPRPRCRKSGWQSHSGPKRMLTRRARVAGGSGGVVTVKVKVWVIVPAAFLAVMMIG
jgi:catechol 2,3-dioxygenase-like lactoylglutathione lyase family enzyme